MELTRRIRLIALALPVALTTGAALVRAAPPGSGAGPASPAACVGALDVAPGTVPNPAGRGTPAWYRLDPMLDGSGTLVGQHLTAGRGMTTWSAELPPEAFATGPVLGRVLAGDDDGTRTRLRVLDTARGCWSQVGVEATVVRSAILVPNGTGIYEHRVDRATRADLGVWYRDLGPAGRAPRRVLPALAPDPAAGPIFTTSLLVSRDGRLVVASCAERVCRTRVLDPATGGVATVAGTGPAVGVTGRALVAFGACLGLPCPLEAHDLDSGAVTVLDEASGPALVAPLDRGSVVLADDAGIGVQPLGSTVDAEVPGTAGLAPVTATSTDTSGIDVPVGLVAVAPAGRVEAASDVHLLDPATLQLGAVEVLP